MHSGMLFFVGITEVALVLLPIVVSQQRKIRDAPKIIVLFLSMLNLAFSVWSCNVALSPFDLMVFGFVSFILWLPPLIISAVAPMKSGQSSRMEINTDPQIDALEHLILLKKQGILTDEEFILKKKQIIQQEFQEIVEKEGV